MDNRLFSKKTQAVLIKKIESFRNKRRGLARAKMEYFLEFLKRNEWVIPYSSETEIEAYLVRYQGWGKETRWKVPLLLITAGLSKRDCELGIQFLSRGIQYGEFDWRDPFTEEVYWRGALLSKVESCGQGVQSPGQTWTLGINIKTHGVRVKPNRRDRTTYSGILPPTDERYLLSTFGLFDMP